MHTPNAKTYRGNLGEAVNRALFLLVEKRNADALKPLKVIEYQRKMVKNWWDNEFPDKPFPAETENYYADLDF